MAYVFTSHFSSAAVGKINEEHKHKVGHIN